MSKEAYRMAPPGEPPTKGSAEPLVGIAPVGRFAEVAIAVCLDQIQGKWRVYTAQNESRESGKKAKEAKDEV